MEAQIDEDDLITDGLSEVSAATQSEEQSWQPFHIDLVILWVENEGIRYKEAIDRICRLFGEEMRIDKKALDNKLYKRRNTLRRGGQARTRIENPKGLTDAQLLDWFRSLMYEEVYVAKVTQNSVDLRKSIDTALKVMKHKRDIGANDEDEDSVAMQALLKAIQGESLPS